MLSGHNGLSPHPFPSSREQIYPVLEDKSYTKWVVIDPSGHPLSFIATASVNDIDWMNADRLKQLFPSSTLMGVDLVLNDTTRFARELTQNDYALVVLATLWGGAFQSIVAQESPSILIMNMGHNDEGLRKLSRRWSKRTLNAAFARNTHLPDKNGEEMIAVIDEPVVMELGEQRYLSIVVE
jgi:hypothetical protein